MRILSAQISQSALQIITLVLLAKFFGAEVVGLYGVMSALINPCYQLLKLGLPKVILASNNETDVWPLVQLGLLSAALLVPTGLSLALAIALFGLSNDFDITSASKLWLFVALLILKALQLGREVIHSLYLQSSNQTLFWRSMFGGNVCSLLVFTAVICSSSSPTSSFFGIVFILTLFTIYDLRQLRGNFSTSFSISALNWRQLSRVSVSDFLVSLRTSIPRVILAETLSYSLAGIFTGIQQAVALLEILNQALLKFYNRHLVQAIHQQNRTLLVKTITRIVTLMLLTVGVSYVVVLHFGDFLLALAFDETFVAYQDILLLLIALRALNMLASIPKFVLIIRDKVTSGIIIGTITLLIAIPFLHASASLQDFVTILIVSEVIYLCAMETTAFRKVLSA